MPSRGVTPAPPMRTSVGILALVAGVLVIAAAYVVVLLPGEVGDGPAWAVAAGTCLLLFGFLDLGARRRDGRSGIVRMVFLGTVVWIGVGFAGILGGAPATLETPFVLGLPLPAAWMIWVLGVGPALLLPIAWALLFRSHTLADDAMDELREARRLREEREAERGRRDDAGHPS